MTHLLSIIAIAAQLATPDAENPAENPAEGGTMKAPTPIAHGSEDGQRVVEGLGNILAEKLSPLDRRRLGKKVLSKSRVSIAQGSFAGGGTRLVALNVNLRMKDPEAVQQYISGLVTVDDAGGLVSVIVPPKMQPEAFAIEKIGDTDGDGSDDFVYTATSAETTTTHRVTWNGTEVVDRANTPKPAEGSES